jgi:hypothetical protein
VTNEELTAIEARANAATLGPWATHDQGREDYSICRDNGNNTCCPLFERIGRDDDGIDGAFIAAARVDVPALIAEVRRLRALVESAYREGFYDGEDDAPIGELPAGYGDTAWWMSDARKALEVQPNDKPTWKHIEPRDAFETEWTILP